MYKLIIPQPSNGILFETTLESTTSVIDKLLKQKDMDKGEITMLRGKKNKVAVGVPYYEV